MPLPLPNLDDRRWNDLVEESRVLIPRYAPGWTDHNVHDPGITLMELFAWLAEMDIFRLNQIPQRHLRKFLALLGIMPKPVQPAQALLAFTHPGGDGPVALPAGTIWQTTGHVHEPIPFRIRSMLTIVNARIVAVQVSDRSGLKDVTPEFVSGIPFWPFGSDPMPGDAFYVGLDQPLEPEVPVAIGVCVAGQLGGWRERERLLAEAIAGREAYRHLRAGSVCNEQNANDAAPSVSSHHSVRLAWEYYANVEGGRWLSLKPEREQVVDDTRALTLTGTIGLVLPTPMAQKSLDEGGEQHYYLRCRLAEGCYDAAPQLAQVRLNTVYGDQVAPVWQELPVVPGCVQTGAFAPGNNRALPLAFSLDAGGAINRLDFEATGGPAVRILDYTSPRDTQAGQLASELVWIGTGSGEPNQQFSLPQAPVAAGSVKVFTLEHNTEGWHWRRWKQRYALDASRRTDRHYILNATTGEFRFGDGERGQAPSAGALVLVTYYSTAAEQGNVPAETGMQLAATPRDGALAEVLSPMVCQVLVAAGGAAAETLNTTIGRAVETLWAHERIQSVCSGDGCETLDQLPDEIVHGLPEPTRAVTTLDIERLALAVPGTDVRRARAWSNRHPDYPCLNAPGVVTVVIVPALPDRRPQPSCGLRRAVHCYLDHRRIVTTRIKVIGPEYVEVRVQAVIQTYPGVDTQRVERDAVEALDTFLDPLRGGPDGVGWPFGRDVYRAEILQLIDNVPGVDHVETLALRDGQGEPACGNLCVPAMALVTPGSHTIEVKRGQRC